MDLKSWYSVDKLQDPIRRPYSAFVDGLDAFQIMTLDARNSRTWLSRVVAGMQPSALDELVSRVDKSANNFRSNSVFSESSQWLHQMVSWRKETADALPP